MLVVLLTLVCLSSLKGLDAESITLQLNGEGREEGGERLLTKPGFEPTTS